MDLGIQGLRTSQAAAPSGVLMDLGTQGLRTKCSPRNRAAAPVGRSRGSGDSGSENLWHPEIGLLPLWEESTPGLRVLRLGTQSRTTCRSLNDRAAAPIGRW